MTAGASTAPALRLSVTGAIVIVAADFAGAWAFFAKWPLAPVWVVAARLGGPFVFGLLAGRAMSTAKAGLRGGVLGAAGLPTALAILAAAWRFRGLPAPFGSLQPRMIAWIAAAGVLGGIGAAAGAFLARAGRSGLSTPA